MADRIRDRTLVLRVLPPTLQARLKQKMTEAEEETIKRITEAEAAAAAENEQQDAERAAMGIIPSAHPSVNKEGQVADLDGVMCQPTEDGSTLWDFHCDGTSYPARLVNLPCPVEMHKTHDHAMYYKCADVGQILIVYEDQAAMEVAENASGYKVEGFPSYYHSGLTPPMKRVVERRFAAREHKIVAPPRSEVSEVEKELKNLIATISRDTSKSKGKNKSSSMSSQNNDANKIIEEIVDDIVDYEPWMDDNGTSVRGIEFDEKDKICTMHPEVWLEPEDTNPASGGGGGGGTTEEKEKKEKEGGKKKSSKSKGSKKKKQAAGGMGGGGESGGAAAPTVKKKKGIASKKARIVDEVSHAAVQIANMGDNDDDLIALDDFFDFNEGDDFTNLDMS